MSLAFWFFAAMSAAGYAGQEGVAVTTPPPVVSPESNVPKSIRGKSVYIYSFLDLREAEYTRKLLDAINGGLSGRLNQIGTQSAILEYRKTLQGEFVADSSGQGSSSTAVPVRAIIEGNAEAEAAAGSQLRLVIFPSRYDVVGAWRYYNIRWLLVDIRSNRPVWSYEYQGKHMVWWSDKENSAARADKILDAAFSDLRTKGFLK